MKPKCPWCLDRSSADALLCQGSGSCTEKLERALGDVAALEDAAMVTYTRAARISSGGGSGRSSTAPPTAVSAPDDQDSDRPDLGAREADLPFDPRIRSELRRLTAAVDAIVRLLAWPGASWSASHPLGYRATWAAAHVRELRARVDDASLHWYGALLLSQDKLEQLVDRPADQAYIGQCNADCGQDLYCSIDLTDPQHPKLLEPLIACPRCGRIWDTNDRRERLLAAAEDVEASATDLARALTRMQEPVTPERIRQWAVRDKITPRGADARGRPTYRLGDVRAILNGKPVGAATTTSGK
ncbi:hypothetical protein GCM10023145_31170 [Angustibacter luteus]